MNPLGFSLTYASTKPVVEREYNPEPIDTAVPYKIGLSDLGCTIVPNTV